MFKKMYYKVAENSLLALIQKFTEFVKRKTLHLFSEVHYRRSKCFNFHCFLLGLKRKSSFFSCFLVLVWNSISVFKV